MTYRRRFVRRAPKAKWNPIFSDGPISYKKDPSYTYSVNITNVVINELPFQLSTSNRLMNGYPAAAPILKVRHPSYTLIIPQSPNSSYGSYIELFMVFIPQGITPSNDLINNHPEWIMARRVVTIIQGATTYTYMKSPLTRNLNSGDKIVVMSRLYWLDSTPKDTSLAATVQTSCVTRAN